MAATLEALARDWKSKSDHAGMRLSLQTWQVRHKNDSSYDPELAILSQEDATILYLGFLELSLTNTQLFFKLMSKSQGSKL